MSEDDNEVSSMEVLKFDLEGEPVISQGEGVVDEISGSPKGVAVYVGGDAVDHNSPPRKLNEKMLEHGYSYVDWAMNGKTGDNRAIFQYAPINDN